MSVDIPSTNGDNAALADDDEEQRAICHRFFDALERGDIDAVRGIYHPDASLWFNILRDTVSVDDNLAKLAAGAALQRRRTYNDRMIDTFAGGFLARFSINVVRHDGSTGCFAAAVVVRTREGRIIELSEYIDAGKFAARPS